MSDLPNDSQNASLSSSLLRRPSSNAGSASTSVQETSSSSAAIAESASESGAESQSAAPIQSGTGTEAGGPSRPAGGADDWWLDRPGSVNLLIKILIAACVASVLADFFYHKHGEFHFQEYPGFDALFGFVAYVGLVNSAKGIRVLLMRSEDYYD